MKNGNGRPHRRVGVWLIGAFGNVATCSVVGARAIASGLASEQGMMTALPELRGLPFVPVQDLVFGGHEIRRSDLYHEAMEFSRRNNVLDRDVLRRLRADLLAVTRNVVEGVSVNCGTVVESLVRRPPKRNRLTLRQIVTAIQDDLRRFRDRERLDDVVVINLASTENGLEKTDALEDIDRFERLLDEDRRACVTSSILYAYAALSLGLPYVNFTPSWGSSLPALDQLAHMRGAPHMGKDAKTGETLVKTALAPMFYIRNFRVLSWEGHNMLGNRDGYVLNDPNNRASKIRDKKGVLDSLLRNPDLHAEVRIDYVPSLDDWKTAWDFIHFEGFLGTKMTMQFTWQGCDSLLAAPLVLDLARFAELAHRTGFAGPMTHLACFFKAPYGVAEHNLQRQFDGLVEYAKSLKRRLCKTGLKV